MQSAVKRGVVAALGPIQSAGIEAILTCSIGLEIAAKVDTFASLLTALQVEKGANQAVQIIVVEDSLLRNDKAGALSQLTHIYSQVRIAIVGLARDRQSVLDALAAGAHGYLPQDLSFDKLVGALRAILDGQLYIPNMITEMSLVPETAIQSTTCSTSRFERLTDRQRDVLDLLVVGRSNKEIGRALQITESTVKIHVSAVFKHIGVHNRLSAIYHIQSLAKNVLTASAPLPLVLADR